MNPAALTANVFLDGIEIHKEASEWVVKPERLAVLERLADGDRREFLTATEEGHPQLAEKRKFVIRWAHLGQSTALVKELLAVPGQHRLVLWRTEYLSYFGGLERREFFLPNSWRLAIDAIAEDLPVGANTELAVRVGDTALAASAVDPAIYDSLEPDVDEAWFRAGDGRFKLGQAPADGAVIYVRVVPEYRVYHDASQPLEQALRDPIHEPLNLALQESGA